MDNRVQNTKKKIKKAFISLRKKKTIEKITVVELCKNAGINKSTFYAHYLDIYDLSDCVEDSVIAEIISSMESPEAIIYNPDYFTKELFASFSDKREQINILFSDTRSVLLPKKIKEALNNLIFTMYPEYKNNPEINIMLSYKIYGGFYTFMENERYGSDLVTSVISNLTNSRPSLISKFVPNDKS